MRGPRWLYYQTNDTLTGVLLLVICAILAVWGVSLLRSAWRQRAGRWPTWGFEFFLGLFMLCDASLYLVLAASVLESPEGIDLWVALLFGAIALPAIAAFVAWARERALP